MAEYSDSEIFRTCSFPDRVVFARKAVQSSGAIFSQADAGEKIVLDVATVSLQDYIILCIIYLTGWLFYDGLYLTH